ncbi:MAG: ribosome-associated translation inhibitor RaiA [candidate division Zixibacteria bacterium]|nr:ribosome-associated translation inhibitor RaiA [candidate division Zixibacteria bacterium]
MKIKVTGRRYEVEERTKDRAISEIEKLNKFFDNIVSASLVLSQDGFRCEGELTMTVSKSKLVSKASTEDMFATIEMVTDKMAAQLKKHKGKMKERDQKGLSERKAKVKLTTKVDEVDY